MVEFTGFNISEFSFLNFSYISRHWKIPINLMISGIKFSKFAISEIAQSKFQWKFSSCRVASHIPANNNMAL